MVVKVAWRFFSYIGKQPILLDPRVSVNISTIFGDNAENHRRTSFKTLVKLNGPLGEVSFPVVRGLDVALDLKPANENNNIETDNLLSNNQPNHELFISMNDSLNLTKYQEKFVRSMWGLTQRLLSNYVIGVTQGHKAIIKLVGIGYKAKIDNHSVVLKVGYSHYHQLPIPVGMSAQCPTPTKIELLGVDKQKLNLFAAKIRSIRKPEPYKGKGIFVNDETIKLKIVNKK